MSNISKHEEEGSAKGYGVSVEPIGGYHHEIHKTKQGAGEVEKVGINWDESQKVTQAVNRIYSSQMFGKENIIDWEDITDTDKTRATCKSYFKEIYAKQRQ